MTAEIPLGRSEQSEVKAQAIQKMVDVLHFRYPLHRIVFARVKQRVHESKLRIDVSLTFRFLLFGENCTGQAEFVEDSESLNSMIFEPYVSFIGFYHLPNCSAHVDVKLKLLQPAKTKAHPKKFQPGKITIADEISRLKSMLDSEGGASRVPKVQRVISPIGSAPKSPSIYDSLDEFSETERENIRRRGLPISYQ